MRSLDRRFTEERRQQISDAHSRAALTRHQRQREDALITMLDWPKGVTPMPGLGLNTLRGLVSRELVEVRFVLTSQGRRAAEQAKQQRSAD